jgi:CDP-paratose synthetase
MKTILITGINGFLGSRLAIKLQTDYEVIGLEYNISGLNRLTGYSFKVYSSQENLENIFLENEVFAIIHAATLYRRNNEPVKNLIQTNVLLPVELYSLANKYNTNLFLNTDSFFNNSTFDYKYLVDYTLSKKQSLEWLKIMQNHCRLINMKIFHMYGKNDAPDKFIPKLLSDITNNVPIVDMTPGEQKRDFIYIDDVVNAFKIIMEKELELKDNFREFQIGNGKSFSIKELALAMVNITNSATKLNFGALPYRENEIMDSVSDNSTLVELGWKAGFSLIDGLKELIN